MENYNPKAGLIIAPLVLLSTAIYGISIALTNEGAYATSQQQNFTSIQGQENTMPTNSTLP